MYTFGEPREMSRGYENRKWTAVHNIRKHRFIYEEDLVSSTPPNLGVTPFHHWGASWHIQDPRVGQITFNQVEYDWPYTFEQTGSVRDHEIENYVDSLR